MKPDVRKLTKAEVWLSALVATLSILFGSDAVGQTAMPDQVDININTDSGVGGWYAQPWVWVIGIALFIIILIAITRGGSREV